MNTIFIGGSRHVSRLPAEVRKRLDNVIASGHRVVIGDANGADKAVQKHLADKQYDEVTVFCSGATPRNNLGSWRTHQVEVPKTIKGFQFYAAKDREMAKDADFGLMIWDGKSPGTVLNVLRLAMAGKIAVLFSVPDKDAVNIKSVDHWKTFVARCSPDLRSDLKDRATLEEWRAIETDRQSNLFASEDTGPSDAPVPPAPETSSLAVSFEGGIALLNTAFDHGDTTAIVEALGSIARTRGMSQIARDTGLARESLYRSLDTRGNPEFATVLKVMSSLGLRLVAQGNGEQPSSASDEDQPAEMAIR